MRRRSLTRSPICGRPGRSEAVCRCISNSSRGFSLPELLVVLLIVSILSAIIVPAIEVVRYEVDGAARASMGALMAAQRVAVKRQHDVIVVFDTDATQIRIHQDGDNDGAVDAGERVRTVVLEDGVRFGRGSAPALDGYTSAVSFTETSQGMPAVRFIRSGSATEGGAFYLTSRRDLPSGSHPGDARMVRVNRATGRVTWYEYTGSAWEQGF